MNTPSSSPENSPSLPVLHEEQSLSLEQRIAELLAANTAVVLLTIVSTQGHVARKVGTRALCTQQGFDGSLGGGLFERRVQEEAQRCLETGESCLFSYTGADDAGRGERHVLCEYLSPACQSLFSFAADLKVESGRGAWMVDITQPARPLRSLVLSTPPSPLPQDWQELLFAGMVRADALLSTKILQKNGGKAFLQKDKDTECYFEPIAIAPVLLICGTNAEARATAALASQCAFTIDVVDDQPQFLSKEYFPSARTLRHLPGMDGLLSAMNVSHEHYVVIMTENYHLDRLILKQLLSSRAAYIGMQGGRQKRVEIFAEMRALGIPSTELACVRCPVGLSIGAETPHETAVSIVAELLAARAGTLKHFRSLEK
ncbi:MAG: XdhC family protein [Desulfovibrio sp.]|nr:XdhC family protein [Desulfovibrio sp.]